MEIWSRYFLVGAGLCLVIVGGAKLVSLSSDAKVLKAIDPIFGVRFSTMMLLVGIAEIAAAWVCFSRHKTAALFLVGWLATMFIAYRLGLSILDWKRPCGCLGALTDTLGISPEKADLWIKVILAYLFLGSYLNLALKWFGRRPQFSENAMGCNNLEVGQEEIR